jgi:hypothetical protein
METTGKNEEQSAANLDTRIVDEEEEKIEYCEETQENFSTLSKSTTATTTTFEPVERPSCIDRNSVVKTDDSVNLQDPPPIKEGLQVDEMDKNEDSHKMIGNGNTRLSEVMDGKAHTISTGDSIILPPLEGQQKIPPILQRDYNNDAATRQDHHELQTTSSKRTRRPHPSKMSSNADPSSSYACLPTSTPSIVTATTTTITTTTITATRRRRNGGKTSDKDHGTTRAPETTPLQGMNMQMSARQQPAASIATTNNANHGYQNGIWASASFPQQQKLHQQQDWQVQHLDNESEASSATTLSLSEQPGAFRIHPNGQDGVHVHDDDDDERMIFIDAVNAVATPSLVPPRDNSSVAASSADAYLPIAQSLEDEALEREVLDRFLSRQPVVQGEKLSPPIQSKIRWWAPFTVGLGVITAMLVILAGTGVLFPNRMENKDLPSVISTAPPAIGEGISSAAVDIEPILQWIEPFLTNRSYSIPTDPESAQYRAIEWLAKYHPPSNATSDEDIDVWVQYYVLVTFYYLVGGETGLWSADRLWLSTEPMCYWAMINCDASPYIQHNQNNNSNQINASESSLAGLNIGTLSRQSDAWPKPSLFAHISFLWAFTNW